MSSRASVPTLPSMEASAMYTAALGAVKVAEHHFLAYPAGQLMVGQSPNIRHDSIQTPTIALTA
jgi:hypothetical protein